MLFQTDLSSSHPACLTSGIQAGETHQQLQLARDQSSERSGPRDALEDARGAGWESRAVPRRRRRAPAGNAASPTTPAGVVRRRAGGRRQGYPGWLKVLGRRRPPCSEGSRARPQSNRRSRLCEGASSKARHRPAESRALRLASRSPGRGLWGAPSRRFQAWLLKASAHKGRGRVLPSGERSSDRPTLHWGDRRGFRRPMVRNRRYGRKCAAAALSLPRPQSEIPSSSVVLPVTASFPGRQGLMSTPNTAEELVRPSSSPEIALQGKDARPCG